MSKTTRLIPVAVLFVVLAALGGWFWNQNSNDNLSEQHRIAQFRGDGVAPPRPLPAPAPLKWKNATPAERKAAQASITAQLEAFKHDDWNKAVSYQSNGLKSNFRSTEQFQQMIESSYPQFADYSKVEFREAQSSGSHLSMAITLTGKDGVKVKATYIMVKEEGQYRVAGVSGGSDSNGGNRRNSNEDPANLI